MSWFLCSSFANLQIKLISFSDYLSGIVIFSFSVCFKFSFFQIPQLYVLNLLLNKLSFQILDFFNWVYYLKLELKLENSGFFINELNYSAIQFLHLILNCHQILLKLSSLLYFSNKFHLFYFTQLKFFLKKCFFSNCR